MTNKLKHNLFRFEKEKYSIRFVNAGKSMTPWKYEAFICICKCFIAYRCQRSVGISWHSCTAVVCWDCCCIANSSNKLFAPNQREDSIKLIQRNSNALLQMNGSSFTTDLRQFYTFWQQQIRCRKSRRKFHRNPCSPI